MKVVDGVNDAYCLSKTRSSEEPQDSLEWGNTAVLTAAAQSLCQKSFVGRTQPLSLTS